MLKSRFHWKSSETRGESFSVVSKRFTSQHVILLSCTLHRRLKRGEVHSRKAENLSESEKRIGRWGRRRDCGLGVNKLLISACRTRTREKEKPCRTRKNFCTSSWRESRERREQKSSTRAQLGTVKIASARKSMCNVQLTTVRRGRTARFAFISVFLAFTVNLPAARVRKELVSGCHRPGLPEIKRRRRRRRKKNFSVFSVLPLSFCRRERATSGEDFHKPTRNCFSSSSIFPDFAVFAQRVCYIWLFIHNFFPLPAFPGTKQKKKAAARERAKSGSLGARSGCDFASEGNLDSSSEQVPVVLWACRMCSLTRWISLRKIESKEE